MNPQIKIDEKVLMISLYNRCHNYREVGRAFNRDKNTVKKWINTWELEGTVLRKVGSGFNRSTTAEEDENIIYTAVENRKINVEDIARECDLEISGITVSQRLKSGGLKRRIATQKRNWMQTIFKIVLILHKIIQTLQSMSGRNSFSLVVSSFCKIKLIFY